MEVKYHPSTQTLEIKDDVKFQYLIVKILMLLNIVNAVLRLVNLDVEKYDIMEYFWIVIGTISLIALYVFSFKFSTAQKIKVEDIKHLNEKSIFGRKRFSLSLTNGKKRILGSFKNEFHWAKMRELFIQIGITN